MNLTLSDFRSVLGKKNDGDVVMRLDQKGLEKANWGGFFRSIFGNVRKVTPSAAENMAIRASLMAAIQNSAEGKVLSEADLQRIESAMGIANGIVDDSKPLSRRELKAVIDIVDQAVQGDKLIDKNVALLNDRGVHDSHVVKGVKNAMDIAKYLQPTSVKAGVASARELFGADFKGRSPAEMEKFVRLNLSAIRAQVFDRLYWSCQSLKDFTETEDLNKTAEFDADGLQAAKISPETVENAFKEVVGSLLEGNGATMRVDTLAQKPSDFTFVDGKAKDVWDTVINKDGKIDKLVNNALWPVSQVPSSYASLQLNSALKAVKNMLCAEFNTLYVNNGSNSQNAEKAFDAKMNSHFAMLKGIADDMAAMKPETALEFYEKVANELGKLVADRDLATSDRWLADTALKALDNVSKDVAPYRLVEGFVAERFAYVPDKKQIVDFFLAKIRGEGGLPADQRKILEDYQSAALNGELTDTLRHDLKLLVLTPIATAYTDAEALKSPEKVKEARQARNETTLASLISIKVPNYSTMDEKGKDKALRTFKIEILLAKYGHEEVCKMGITDGPGSERIKSNGSGVPDPEALQKLDKELLKLDDRDFEFCSQYCAKGMRAADRDLCGIAEAYVRKNLNPIFQNALNDGTISIASVPAAAVPMLKELITARIYSVASMNGGYDHVGSAREFLSNNESGISLAAALFKRLSGRIAASGIANVPEHCAMPKPGETDENLARRLKNAADSGYTMVRGFGTTDLGRILRLLDEMGIDLAVLGGNDDNAKLEVYEKVLSLSLLAAMNGYKLDGLAEFTERVIGKQFKDVNYGDVLAALNKNKLISANGAMMANTTVGDADPITKLTGEQKTLKELFSGEMSLAGAKLPAKDAVSLLKSARELALAKSGTVKTAKVELKGVPVTLTRLANGDLSVKVGDMPMRAAFDMHGLVRMLENEVASNPANFEPDVVKSTLPTIDDVKNGAVPLVRARELFAKTAAAKLNVLPVMFSSYNTEELRKVAVDVVDGKFTVNNLPKEPPKSYNSGAMLEMHEKLSRTSVGEVESKVKIAAPAARDIDARNAVEPDPQVVHNLVADLFLNKDTWEFDAGKGDGERIRKFLVENKPELGFILKHLDDENMGLLSSLPKEVREAVKSVFEDIKGIDISKLLNPKEVGEEVRTKLKAIETKIDAVAETVVGSMQAKVTELFSPKVNAQGVKSDWQKSFAELAGKDGIDVNTKQGAFTKKVLDNYFKNSAGVDKRAMLSAFIRNTDAGSSDAKQVAELLKGAGPLLQKMLQGLPLSSFNAETQLALKDMKSRLLPIPDEAVKAQMLELVNSSNGNILSIEVKKSLGAATVGQAFLCNIKTKAHPFVGEECVVKLLRPNVDTAIQREKALIDKLVANDPAMKATFDGQYRKILEEFDLTLESTNVGIGTKIYEMTGGNEKLHSMQMLDGTTSTMTSMVIKKADGATFDAVIENARADMKKILDPITFTTEIGGVKKTVYKAQNPKEMALARRTLLARAAQLNDRRNHVLDVTAAWFENALFGNGFFHGDLHGGNLMTGTSGTTFIDFGNCSRLSKEEQNAITLMLASTVSGDVKHVRSNFRKLLPPDAQRAFDAKFADKSKALAELDAVLRRGTAYDLMSRLQAFIAVVQGEDVQIPPALQNFVQSYMRLADIISDIDRTVEDLQIAAASIYCDCPGLDPVENEPQVFADYKAIARAFIGNANTPFSADAVQQAIDKAQKNAKTEKCKAEIRELLYDGNNPSIEKFMTNIYPVCKQLEEEVYAYEKDSIVPTMGNIGRYSPIGHVIQTGETIEYAREEIKQLQAEKVRLQSLEEKDRPADYDKKIKDIDTGLERANARLSGALDEMDKRLGNLSGDAADYFIRSMQLVRGSKSTFSDVAIKRDKSMTDVCCDVLRKFQGPLGEAAGKEFGTFGQIGFAVRLRNEFQRADAVATRRKNIGPELVKKNSELTPDKRLSGQDLAALMRATDSFFVQSTRPDAKSGWDKTPASCTALFDAIYYNLQRAAEALKVQVRNMSGSAITLAALNFGLADGKLVESITSLSQKDYDALLVRAGQAEMNDTNKPLTTALDALRGSKDLLDRVSTEAEEVANAAGDDDDE